MKVRLAAEEYSRHASLCARTPTRCADLLRRRLRVPLASCVGNRPRYSVRLRGHALHPGLAGPGSSGPCNGHARADTRGCGKPRSSGSNRECRSLGGRDRKAELDSEAGDLETIRKAGVQVNDIADTKPFRDMMGPVYQEVGAKVGKEWLDKVLDSAK